ncbi:MAG: DUF5919 domain-containing protein [Actinomycetota bacterium]
MDNEAEGQVVDLRAKLHAQADPAAIARQNIQDARQVAGADEAAFAGQLSRMVGWEVTPELVTLWETEITPPGDVVTAAQLLGGGPSQITVDVRPQALAGIEAAYATRAEFVAATALDQLFDTADNIWAVGLSHNLLCQQYPNEKLIAKLNNGSAVEMLFLQPGGEAIAQREEEEHYQIGYLSSLTDLNLTTMVERVRPKLQPGAATNLRIGTYDETIRFNLIFVDQDVCIMQPYLHGDRGISTPTIVVKKQPEPGIYDTMWASYQWLRERANFQ